MKPLHACLIPALALFLSQDAEAFCVENHTQAVIVVRQTAGGAKTLRGARSIDAKGGVVENAQFSPTETCVPTDDDKWNPDGGKTTLLWIDGTWYGQWEAGWTSPSDPSAPAVQVCPEAPLESGGRLVITYDGKLEPGGTPRSSKFHCERLNVDGSKRADTGPTVASWAGNHSCEQKFPATKKHGKAFRHRLTSSCYSCPKGYTRTVWKIDGNKACKKGGFVEIREPASAVKRGAWGCAKGAFKNGLLDQCYTCPKGFKERITGLFAPDLTRARVCYPPGYPK